jgi:hypothetical protein
MRLCASQRLARSFERAQRDLLAAPERLDEAAFEAHNLIAQSLARETAALKSFADFTQDRPAAMTAARRLLKDEAATFDRWLTDAATRRGAHAARFVPAWQAGATAHQVPRRIGEFGPLTYQNDDVLLDRLGPQRLKSIKLLAGDASRLVNAQENGALYAYEILNFVDGKRTVGEIRDAVAAEFGAIPLDWVADYLQACEEAHIISLR